MGYIFIVIKGATAAGAAATGAVLTEAAATGASATEVAAIRAATTGAKENSSHGNGSRVSIRSRSSNCQRSSTTIKCTKQSSYSLYRY